MFSSFPAHLLLVLLQLTNNCISQNKIGCATGTNNPPILIALYGKGLFISKSDDYWTGLLRSSLKRTDFGIQAPSVLWFHSSEITAKGEKRKWTTEQAALQVTPTTLPTSHRWEPSHPPKSNCKGGWKIELSQILKKGRKNWDLVNTSIFSAHLTPLWR